jgi:hypothetical protein
MMEHKLESPLIIDRPEEELIDMAKKTRKLLKIYLTVAVVSLILAAIVNSISLFLLSIVTLCMSIILVVNVKYIETVILIKREKNKKR